MSKEAQEESFYIVAKLWELRYQKRLQEEQIAEKLGFAAKLGRTPLQVMRGRLKDLELPDWLVYGGASEDKDELSTTMDAKTASSKGTGEPDPLPDGSKRKPLSTGKVTKLPPAGAAKDLFREALQELAQYIDPPEPPKDRPVDFMDVVLPTDLLDSLEEYLQAERFVTAGVDRPAPEHMRVVRREYLSAEEWERACEEYGEDPSKDYFWIGAETDIFPYGAKQAPSDKLVKLIGTYVLMGKPLEPLLEKLHPEPEAVNWQQLKEYIHGKYSSSGVYTPGMLHLSRRISRVMRGGTVRSGPKTGELSGMELFFAWHVSLRKRQGASYKRIYEELKDTLEELGYSLRDIERWGGIDPPKPGSVDSEESG